MEFFVFTSSLGLHDHGVFHQSLPKINVLYFRGDHGLRSYDLSSFGKRHGQLGDVDFVILTQASIIWSSHQCFSQGNDLSPSGLALGVSL